MNWFLVRAGGCFSYWGSEKEIHISKRCMYFEKRRDVLPIIPPIQGSCFQSRGGTFQDCPIYLRAYFYTAINLPVADIGNEL